MSIKPDTMTKDYADSIEGGLKGVDLIESYWHEHQDARAASVALHWDATRPNAEAVTREAWSLAESENVFERTDDYRSPISLWIEDALEITILGEMLPGGEWEPTGVKILLSYGGPNVWLTRTFDHGTGYVELLTFWGGDEDRRGIYGLSPLCDALESFSEMIVQ